MRILALSTSTPRFGVALVEGRDLLASYEHDEEMKHAERLFPAVERVLAEAGWSRRQLDAIACDIGPGSFTGVRVGLASAKGMALALEVPLYPVGSLEAMAAAGLAVAPVEPDRIACAVDARRGELFVAVYGADREVVLDPEHLLRDTVEDRLAELGFGEVPRCGRVWRDEVAGERYLDHRSCELPSAAWVGKVASDRGASPPPPLERIEPTYVRGADAKLPTR